MNEAYNNDDDGREQPLSWADFSEEHGTPMEIEREMLSANDGLESYIPGLGEYLPCGLVPGMHVLMAEPGAGKSALALQVAGCNAMAGHRVLYVSAEMGRAECYARLASNMSASIPGMEPFEWSSWWRESARLRRAGMDADAAGNPMVAALREQFARASSLVVADGIHTVPELEEEAGRAASAGMELMVLDYLQRIRPGGAAVDMYTGVTQVAESVAGMAKDLQVPIVAISSMNRAGMRSDSPDMTALRGSGDIEFAATTVMSLSKGGKDSELELRILKNRCGRCTYGGAGPSSWASTGRTASSIPSSNGGDGAGRMDGPPLPYEGGPCTTKRS